MTRIELRPGFSLNAEIAGSGPPLVLLHGFTGSAGAWGDFAGLLAKQRTTIALDIVGHGASDKPADVACYTMPQVVTDIAGVLQRLGHGRASLLGYSMGGRTALHLAVAWPDLFDALITVGGAPGIADPAERAARVAADEALAGRIEREGIEAFVDYWERIPLFESQQRLPDERRAAIRAGRLACDPTGLANSLRGMGAGAQEPLHDALSAIRLPTLAVAGELDAKYVTIAYELASATPGGRASVIGDAGHAPHIEQPQVTADAVLHFLEDIRRDQP